MNVTTTRHRRAVTPTAYRRHPFERAVGPINPVIEITLPVSLSSASCSHIDPSACRPLPNYGRGPKQRDASAMVSGWRAPCRLLGSALSRSGGKASVDHSGLPADVAWHPFQADNSFASLELRLLPSTYWLSLGADRRGWKGGTYEISSGSSPPCLVSSAAINGARRSRYVS